MLNDAEIKPGYRVKVERAQFEQKGEYKAREKKELDEIAKIRLKTNQEKYESQSFRAFNWNDEDEGEGLRIVVIRNMFTPEEIIASPGFAAEMEEDVRAECEEKLGPVKKITVHEFNPEGVVQIKFENPKSAVDCIQV
jgi:HIV Tat-specific factor 1